MSETDWIINAGMYAVTPEVHSERLLPTPEPPDGSPDTGHSNGENATFHTT